eukprot:TRINITY_DN3781_c0_g1_i1.p2 TRINITY_DN3781_c0_g1~~TRINITY_DN3781_c0_g1_i1.p2  ORF type:complete len:110 (+),score=37.19 TRINITY_DN3781_c0_g1_i1:232-561(+)
MESPIVAVCVRTLAAAQRLLDVARRCGFKKPTITGVRGKIMVSIVDNKHVELPISIIPPPPDRPDLPQDPALVLADEQYITRVVEVSNVKLLRSRERMELLRRGVLALL